MSTFTQHRAQRSKVKQIGTVGLCWTLLLLTIYHFFIGHKWGTSVSTWLSFHTKHLNRDSSPIVAPLCSFKPTCVSCIKPQKAQKSVLYQKVYIWKWFDYRTPFRRFFNVYSVTVFFKGFVYVAWSFNTQLIWQLCKPEPNMPTLDLAFFKFDLKAPHVFDFFLITSCLLGQL